MPVLGVVRPGAVTAAAATRSGPRRRDRHAGDGRVRAPIRLPSTRPIAGWRCRQQACPDLVPLVEAGKLDGPDVAAAVDGYLDRCWPGIPQIDTLLLGCTHYPLLRPVIERRAGPTVAVVDSAFTTALAPRTCWTCSATVRPPATIRATG